MLADFVQLFMSIKRNVTRRGWILYDIPDCVVSVVAASLQLLVKMSKFTTFLHHKG
jgi:hypothetical protein